jgi:hypothetical protein
MLTLRKVATSLLRSTMPAVSYQFSNDRWKDRDEAAEKVYINEQESNYALMQNRLLRSC